MILFLLCGSGVCYQTDDIFYDEGIMKEAFLDECKARVYDILLGLVGREYRSTEDFADEISYRVCSGAKNGLEALKMYPWEFADYYETWYVAPSSLEGFNPYSEEYLNDVWEDMLGFACFKIAIGVLPDGYESFTLQEEMLPAIGENLDRYERYVFERGSKIDYAYSPDERVSYKRAAIEKISVPIDLCALSFPGFYESIFSDTIMGLEDMELIIGLEAGSLTEGDEKRILESINYSAYKEDLSDFYMESYIDFLNDAYPGLIYYDELSGTKLISPSSYNYTTDQLFRRVFLPRAKLAEVHKVCLEDPNFQKFLDDNFWDRPGFVTPIPIDQYYWQDLEELTETQINYMLYFYTTTSSVEERLGVLADVVSEDCLESNIDPFYYVDPDVIAQIEREKSQLKSLAPETDTKKITLRPTKEGPRGIKR